MILCRWIVVFVVIDCCCWVMDLWLSQSQQLIVAVAVVGAAVVFSLIHCWLLQSLIVGCCGHGLWLLWLFIDCWLLWS